MHRYLEIKFWSTRSARMTTMARVVPQPFSKNCLIITSSDDLWVLCHSVTWSGFSCKSTLQVIYKCEREITSIEGFSVPRELEQQSLNERRKRDPEKDNVEWRMKCSAGTDTGTCLVLSVDPTFLIIFQISQTLPCVISVTTEQKIAVKYNRSIEINDWWPNSVSTPKANTLKSTYLGQLREKRWERTTELSSRNAV